mmetsp:Transcript_15174/g.21282  ORF Transcript_15174/g.21282 Transcript_15174/m.21282 type:complete len:110 (+) Transcript_15174:2046-2375(+)
MKKSFVKLNTKKLMRIKKKWRKPVGIDSKIRKGMKGYPKNPNIGFGTSLVIKTQNKSGKRLLHINSINDVLSYLLLKNTYVFIISKKMSSYNRRIIRYLASQFKMELLN